MILSKFVDELPISPILKPRWKGPFQTYYEVKMTEFKQSLHSELNDTTDGAMKAATQVLQLK
jgi:spore coat protein A, manganese oxidase